MRYRHCIRLLVFINLLSVTIIGKAQPTETLTIFAASSLTDAFTELKQEFMISHPDVDILLNFAGSSTLAAQINAGAPADIYASANDMQMDVVIEDRHINKSDVEIFATNQLVVAMPVDNPANIETIEDLANEGVLLVLAVPDVPIRAYTKDMLERLNLEYGDDFAQRVLSNLVSEEANVRQVITRIILGEADAGIVYRTDVIGEISQQVTILPIDTTLSPQVTYPIAPLSDSPQLSLARMFIELVLSDNGQEILLRHGFCSPVTIDSDVIVEATPEVTSEPFDEAEPSTQQCK